MNIRATTILAHPSQVQYVLMILVLAALIGGLGLAVLFGLVPELSVLKGLLGLSVLLLLVNYPEIPLALLLAGGTIKGNPRVSELGFDLTLATAIVLTVALVRNYLKRPWSLQSMLPREYLLYIPFFALILFSLTYTPNLQVGLDKAARFFVFSGLAMFAPFLLLDSPERMRRFLMVLAIAGLVVALDSLSMLGGKERLVPTGGDTIQLGHDSAVAIVIIWFLLLPRGAFFSRLLLYGTILLLAVALVGSGSRGPVVSVPVCLLCSLALHKWLRVGLRSQLIHFAALLAFTLAVLPAVPIPEQSYDYLGRLLDPNIHRVLGPREGLLRLGMRLTLEHPLGGVGIGGFPVLYRGVGAWPHNVILEIACELGVLAAALFVWIFGASFRESMRQVSTAAPAFRLLCNTTFALLVLEVINMMNTGSINDHRSLWLVMSLPFVLANLQRQTQEIHCRERLEATAPARFAP